MMILMHGTGKAALWLTIFVTVFLGLGTGLAAAKPLKTVTEKYRSDLGAGSPELDIYGFTGAKNAPVVVFVHGGTWQEGDKAQGPNRVALFNDAGMILVSINYRLVPENTIEGELEDVDRALQWIRANIANYGGNPDNISLFGHSAGAHLVTQTVVDPLPATRAMIDAGAIRGVYASDLMTYDFAAYFDASGGRLAPAHERALGRDRARIAALSPLQHVDPAQKIPPFLISYSGQRPADVRRTSARAFAQALRDAGGSAQLLDGTRYNHAGIIRAVGNDPAFSATVLAFFRSRAGL